MGGTAERSGGLAAREAIVVTMGGRADLRDVEWQKGLQLTILHANQSIWGLCFFNQEWPNTSGVHREEIRFIRTFS